MTDFALRRNRDAWYVIRGYKYQVDLTILRWLTIAETHVLLLEFGEDIDIVNNSIVSGVDDFDRALEQVKHLDKPITLRSPECKAALANAVQHFEANPSQNIIFRFCTNAAITTERPSAFDDRSAGISVWESLRKKSDSKPDSTARLTDLLAFLRDLEKPREAVDDETWADFTDFVREASLDDLNTFVGRFEWSTQQLGAKDVSVEILRLLQSNGCSSAAGAKNIYARLFLHVMQLLSQPGEKRLDAHSLKQISALPTLSDADASLLKFLTSQVLSQAVRLEQVEVVTERHEDAISEIRRNLLRDKYGQVESLNLSAAIAEISTNLPPQVRMLAKRRTSVAALKRRLLDHDWVAIYGSIGCGKTQLATLLGQQLDSLVYVSLRDLSSTEANVLLHHLFLQLCHDDRTGSVTDSGLTAAGHGTAFFLDDVPRLIPGDQLSQRLIRIAHRVRVRRQALVTLSHFPVPPDIVSRLQDGCFSELLAPSFDLNDVEELFKQHGAPAETLSKETAAAFLNSTSGNPTLLSAIARAMAAQGWRHIEKQRSHSAAGAAAGEVIEQTTFRLLRTVEEQDSRELLYRLCVVNGAFGMSEVGALSHVQPQLAKPVEAYARLQGLWIEKQSETLSVVCPLIAQVGASELGEEVVKGVANTLATLVFEKGRISPIDFGKAINYLHVAKNGPSLGMHLLQGLESVGDLPLAWRRIIFLASAREGLLEECPTELGLLIKAKQLQLAQSIGASLRELVAEANKLIAHAEQGELWAVAGYAAQAVPIVAKYDLAQGLRLCKLVLESIEDVVRIRNEAVGKPLDEKLKDAFEAGFPWLLVAELNTTEDFMAWAKLISDQPQARVEKIFASELAPEGFKLAIDRLWMVQHELPRDKQEYASVLDAYDAAISLCDRNALRLYHALVVRAQIIVFSEYLNDLPKAVELANTFLNAGDNTDEVKFLIRESIGRQHLYAKEKREAIKQLRMACHLDTGTFDGLRCRAFLELSRAIGDEDCGEALTLSEKAVAIARRNPRGVSDLDMVSSLGEAAIAAGFDDKYSLAFDYLEEAFSIMSREFDETIDWKMRCVLLGNALGYFASMASSGSPPASDYTVPPRGHLISYNEALAAWYDEADYQRFDLVPTLLVMFANAVGKDERAVFWANKGIDDARAKGVVTCIYSLGELLVPYLITQDKIEQALDYASESALALAASVVAHRETSPDIREGHNAIELLGEKPNDDWSQAEKHFLFTGVIPSILYCCVHEGDKREDLQHLAAHCSAKARDASDSSQFSSVSDAINSFLAEDSSAELHSRALGESSKDNQTGMVASYLLSSFAKDASLKLAVVQHALVMHYCSTRIQGRSALWRFLANQLTEFWRNEFQERRFSFSSPALVEEALLELEVGEPETQVKRLIQTILSGLSVRLPTQLESTSEWLRS